MVKFRRRLNASVEASTTGKITLVVQKINAYNARPEIRR